MDRLADDHTRAKTLVAGLRERGWQVGDPETNIVLLPVADLDATLRRFADAGVLASTMSGKVRLMPHADLTDADIAAALDRIGPVDPTPTAERNGMIGPAARRGAGRVPARRAR
jgi:threonine aldolase